MKRKAVSETSTTLMALSPDEVKLIAEHRRNVGAFTRLALDVAQAIFDREYERAMDGARVAICGIAAGVADAKGGAK